MKRLLHLMCFVLLMQSFTANGQDIHFTQFYASPLYLNPAFAGANTCFRVTMAYRNQWSGVPNGYRSSLLSIDHYAHRQRIGMGLIIVNDVAGTGNLRRTEIAPILATEIRATKNLSFRFGAQPTVGAVSVDFDKLLFGDQIARGGGVTTIENPTATRAYFDMNSGLLAFTKNSWMGVSVFHFLEPLESLMPDEEVGLPMKWSVHGGHKFGIGESDVKRAEGLQSITAVFNYRGQATFDQLDLGFYYTKDVFNIGFWYRGLPGIKSYAPGYANDDAVAIILGLKTERMNIGYSYDFTISALTNASSGAHEITLSAQLCNPKKRRRRPKSHVPCPSF